MEVIFIYFKYLVLMALKQEAGSGVIIRWKYWAF